MLPASLWLNYCRTKFVRKSIFFLGASVSSPQAIGLLQQLTFSNNKAGHTNLIGTTLSKCSTLKNNWITKRNTTVWLPALHNKLVTKSHVLSSVFIRPCCDYGDLEWNWRLYCYPKKAFRKMSHGGVLCSLCEWKLSLY